MPKSSPKKLFSLSILLLILFAVNVHPQVRRANYEILGISVEGNKSADATTIIANTGLKVGDEIEIPGDATINAIKRLWSLNIFSDVQVLLDKKIGNGAFILIKVTEHPRVEKAIIRGNDEIDEDDIDKEINLISGQILKPQEVKHIELKIKDLYYEDGFLNVQITPIQYTFVRADTIDGEIVVTWHNEDDFSDEIETYYDYSRDSRSNTVSRVKERIVLVFDIEEGDEVIVRKIEFEGNENFEDGELRGTFDETSEATWWKFWSSSNFNSEEYQEDKKLLKTFYKKNGFTDFEILRDTLIYSNEKKDLAIKLWVNEGEQYKIRNIVWKGNTIHTDSTLTERLGFRKGDVYDYEKFSQNLYFNEKQTDVSSLYNDEGYLMFTVDPKEEKVAKDSMDIVIRVTENNRFRIDNVKITGNTKTKDKVIRRELYTIPGDYYSRQGVFRSIQNLANLNYFNVEKLYTEGVNPRPVSDSTVNITYKVEEKSSDYLNASVGYSGSFGFSGALGVQLTNFSLDSPFSMGGGQVLDFSWQFGVGNFYRTFRIGFTEPWFLDTPTLIGFDIFDTRQNYVYELQQSGATLKFGRRLKWPDNYFTTQGFFRFQYNDVINGGSTYAEGLSRQYTLGGTISRTDIDNPIFPSSGSKVALAAELSGGPFLPGDVDYYKIELKTEWYKRLFNTNRLTFYTSVDAGYIDELVSGTTIQPFEYFYMGGNGLVIATTPLRGYDDRSIGPRGSDGRVRGGRIKVKYTTELRAALALDPIPIYFLAFAEAGNVFLNFPEADFFDLKRSVGVGARLMVNPIGLIGFDYGYGFDRKSVDPDEDAGWEFHFQFGRGF